MVLHAVILANKVSMVSNKPMSLNASETKVCLIIFQRFPYFLKIFC